MGPIFSPWRATIAVCLLLFAGITLGGGCSEGDDVGTCFFRCKGGSSNSLFGCKVTKKPSDGCAAIAKEFCQTLGTTTGRALFEADCFVDCRSPSTCADCAPSWHPKLCVEPDAGDGSTDGDASGDTSTEDAPDAAAETGGSGGGPAHGEPGPSCEGMSGAECQGRSCCENTLNPAGTFPMGRSDSGTDAFKGNSDEQPEHTATVADFYLDTFEVTVGRFRRFVEQYDGTRPAKGAAAHPLIDGSGWDLTWDDKLPDTREALKSNLKCSVENQTWTDALGANERFAISCVSWFEAFAFCAFDGGRLPTEAEWEYASAGGAQNRLYPWGQVPPNASHANCIGSKNTPFFNVGSHLDGGGRWGQHDLAGNMWEWTLDWYDPPWYGGSGNSCVNCANLANGSERVVRGASWGNYVSFLRAATRAYAEPAKRYDRIGLRCARTP